MDDVELTQLLTAAVGAAGPPPGDPGATMGWADRVGDLVLLLADQGSRVRRELLSVGGSIEITGTITGVQPRIKRRDGRPGNLGKFTMRPDFGTQPGDDSFWVDLTRADGASLMAEVQRLHKGRPKVRACTQTRYEMIGSERRLEGGREVGHPYLLWIKPEGEPTPAPEPPPNTPISPSAEAITADDEWADAETCAAEHEAVAEQVAALPERAKVAARKMRKATGIPWGAFSPAQLGDFSAAVGRLVVEEPVGV